MILRKYFWLKAPIIAGLLVLSGSAFSDEPYTVAVDGTDPWAGTNVTNFLDANSTLTNETTAIQLQANTTIGAAAGAVAYIANNVNGDDEVNINIATITGQQASLTWTFSPTIFPLGVNSPGLRFRDVDANTSGFLETPAGASDEFCDRLEISALDINGAPISVANISAATGTGPTTFGQVTATAPANTFVIEGNANDNAGNGEAVITFNANNIASITIVYEECQEDADTDRPGAIGLVGGLEGFTLFTTDLRLAKQWEDANIGDTSVVEISGGTVTLTNFNSTAGSLNDNDTAAAQEIISGVDYTITEILGAANSGTYNGVLTCSGSGDGDVSDGVLTPASGDTNVTCTYTNTRLPFANLRVVKTDVDGSTTYTPGAAVSYRITVTNAGPDDSDGAVITDSIPNGVTSVSWGCTATGGAVCPNASGTGNINETIATLPNGGELIYTITGTYSSSAGDY